VTSCFELLEFLGGNAIVDSITRMQPDGTADVCRYRDGVPDGVDFGVDQNGAYLVHATDRIAIGFTELPSCDALTLQPGINLIGIPAPTAGLSCFALLERLGVDAVAAVERLGAAAQAFDACAVTETGEPAGKNYPIIAGEAYLVSVTRAVDSVNFNETADTERCAIPPGS
jgi:hypothetical protein